MFKLIRGFGSCKEALVSTLGLALIASAIVMSPCSAAAKGQHHDKGKFAVGFSGDDFFTVGTGMLEGDGMGGVTGTLTFFGDGPICTDSVSGPETLNADGVTGTITLTLKFVSSANGAVASGCADGDTLTFAFARDENGQTIELAEIDQYTEGTFAEDFDQIVGVARKQESGKAKGTYGYQFNGDAGFDTGSGSVSVNNSGAVSGSMSLNADGCICQNTVAGTLTPSSDGVTGIMALTVTNVSVLPVTCTASSCGNKDKLTLATAVDEDGKELQFAEVDSFSTGNFDENVDPIFGVMHRTK